jgi:hypothetical protein
MKLRSLTLAACGAALFAAPVWAHHSHAMYDATKELTLEGVIKEMRWVNPHAWLYFVVKNEDGTTRTWALEGPGVAGLVRRGFTQESLAPGIPIKVNCYPLRGGGPGCLGGYILELNGEVLPPTHDRHAGREFD